MPRFDGTGPATSSSINSGKRGSCSPAKTNYGNYLDSGFEYDELYIRPHAPWGDRTEYFNWSPFIYDAPPTDITSEIDMLKAEVVSMNNATEMINREIAHLENKKKHILKQRNSNNA